MSYLNQILDKLKDNADLCVYELYIQNNLERFCTISSEDFEDVYYALFDDNISDLELAENIILDIELFDDFNERIDILYKELIYECTKTYSYVRFLAEVDKSKWDDIINKNIALQDIKKETRIFNFYKKLRAGQLNLYKIQG